MHQFNNWGGGAFTLWPYWPRRNFRHQGHEFNIIGRGLHEFHDQAFRFYEKVNNS